MAVTCDALAARVQEFDDSTAALIEPQPGSKVIKSYDAYYYQGPSYTQGLWRWMVGESRETTKMYLNEMVDRLVVLMAEAETFLTKNTNTKWSRTLRKIDGRKRIFSGTPVTPELIGQIADVLGQIDRLTKRLRLVLNHLKETYPEEVLVAGEAGKSDAEPEADDKDAEADAESTTSSTTSTSSADSVSVFETWNQTLSEAHAALCAASSSFRP